MMPIISMQRRLRQAGRIRIGAKVPTSKGGTRPAKLDAFRFTSPDESAIEAVADLYGGEVQPWPGAAVGTQWEVLTKTTQFDIIVPPTDIAFSQWYEMWSGGGCQRRCDGVTNILTDAPCACNPDNPDCKPTTRLNVILADIEGIGVWRLESHGYNSAAEISGSIEVLKQIQSRNGAMVPGRLLLEQRQSKRIGENGKAETFNFAVPVLDFKLNVAAVASGRPPVTPIQQSAPELPSVVEQVAAVTQPKERPRRANSSAPLPSTGLKPRGVETKPEAVEEEQAPDINEMGVPTNRFRRLMALTGRMGDDGRKEWATVILEREKNPVKSFNDLTANEVERLIGAASEPEKKQYAPDDEERPF